MSPQRRRLSNVIGFDDAPFPHDHRGDVRLIGTVCARTRLDGVLSGKIRRDGANAAARMSAMLRESPFREHVQAILLQGIAVGGFNVVDVAALTESAGVPALVVMRRMPDLEGIRRALAARPGGERKWRLIEAAGPIERIDPVFVQRVGLSLDEARDLLRATTLHGSLPEPLRLAHLIAGGVTTGVSRGRA
ncbi:MAG: DUF99 family protein [Polyangiaceae bacterium]